MFCNVLQCFTLLFVPPPNWQKTWRVSFDINFSTPPNELLDLPRPVIEYIEPIVLTEEEEQMLENELNHDDEALQVGEGNYQVWVEVSFI